MRATEASPFEVLANVGPPRGGPLGRVVELRLSRALVAGALVRRLFHQLRIGPSLIGDLCQHSHVFLDVLLGERLTGLDRHRLRYHPRVVAGPVVLESEVTDPAKDVVGPDTRLVGEVLPRPAALLETAMALRIGVRDPGNLLGELHEVVVVEGGHLSSFTQALRTHHYRPGIRAQDNTSRTKKALDLPDGIRPVVVDVEMSGL